MVVRLSREQILKQLCCVRAQVILRRDWRHYTTHLDFSLGNDVVQVKDHYDGVIGQFINAKIEEGDLFRDVNETLTMHAKIK